MKTTLVLISAALIAALVVFGCSQSSDSHAPGDHSTMSKDNSSMPMDQPENAKGETGVGSTADSPPKAEPVSFSNEKGELVCPVSGDVIPSKESASGFEDYKGKRYYFCCASCPPQFKENPEKFAEGKAIESGEAKSMH